MRRLISITNTLDWGCEHSDADVESYDAACADAVRDAFPGVEVTCGSRQISRARVIVTTRGEDGRIDASHATSEEESHIEESVQEILQRVWEDGNFWTPESESVGGE